MDSGRTRPPSKRFIGRSAWTANGVTGREQIQKELDAVVQDKMSL